MTTTINSEWPVGRTITAVRPMTDAELEREGWFKSRVMPDPVALELDDGTVLYPAQDGEGNNYGALFGIDPDNKSVRIQVFT